MGDIRLGVGFWLFDLEKHKNGNLAVGLGFKLPTENYNASDIFYNVGPNDEPQAIMAVPNQYSIRTGISYNNSPSISSSIGTRFYCVPVRDLTSGNNGFRKPGSVLSKDPGIGLNKNNFSFNLNIPFAIRRERLQSITDIQTEQSTGTPRHIDTAFTDYAINFGVTYRIINNKVKISPEFLDEFKKQHFYTF